MTSTSTGSRGFPYLPHGSLSTSTRCSGGSEFPPFLSLFLSLALSPPTHTPTPPTPPPPLAVISARERRYSLTSQASFMLARFLKSKNRLRNRAVQLRRDEGYLNSDSIFFASFRTCPQYHPADFFLFLSPHTMYSLLFVTVLCHRLVTICQC